MKIFILVLFFAQNLFAVNIEQVKKELETTGVQGWIHGDLEKGNLVFTYRTPGNFFDYVMMSLVSYDTQIQKQLVNLKRHDKILVKGRFIKNTGPQYHILVSSVDVLEKFEPKFVSEPYKYQAKLPQELMNKSKDVFLVHAIGAEGKILVTEYKDTVVPIYVRNGELTKNLFRNDVVELNYKIMNDPAMPMHLVIDESVKEPVKVLDSIKAWHGSDMALEGELILFPKSPEINFNVFALKQNLQDGLSRQFTLVNFDDPYEFTRIRTFLQKAWDKYPTEYVNGRNKFISKKIHVRARGIINEQSPNQANPQILLKSVSSLEIFEFLP